MIARLFALLLLLVCAVPAVAQDDPAALLTALAGKNYKETEAAIAAIAASGDDRLVAALEALGEGDLYARKSDGVIVIAHKAGGKLDLTDPLTGESLGEAASRDLEKVKVNNRLRRAVRSAIGALTLMSPNPTVRLTAAETIFRAADAESLETVEAALKEEQDPTVRAAMERARAAALLASDRPDEEKVAAIDRIAATGSRDTLALLTPLLSSEVDAIRAAAEKGIAHVNSGLAMWDGAQNVWYGISLGSVLLLAAIGLAITFGVMGVINMAHGEMVMLGAYTTFVVQEIIRNSAPWLFDWSLAIALPLAFLVSGLAGLIIERGVIQFLYGRPLETLLATWGVSLVLQQGVRSTFGASNREVGNPSWMSGAFDIGGLSITYNRLWIVVFTLAVFAVLLIVTRWTTFGLQMRAVTQNRRMAASMGIRTPWIDAFTFALGSGIAGIAGLALSQIDNVSPNLGQGYIIDSFMVVVFGGVGNIWGTLVGAFTLGVANKFLEPYAGAVLGKILVLVFIILFIQKRPRGLFALRGRAVGILMNRSFLFGMSRSALPIVLILLAIAALVPAAHHLLPPDHPLHVPTYAVALFGKYLCYALLAVALNLVWGYCGILSLGHGAFFSLGGYAMGMYLMRQIGSRGVYGHPILPDFMVFLNWKELPFYWYGFDSFIYAALMVVLVPGVLAFVFGWFAFRSRVTGVYLSIITQALTFALLLGFFRNNFGFGGNNGLTDFREILGLPIRADATRSALFAISAIALALGVLTTAAIVRSKFGKVLIAVRDAESRTRFLGYRVEHVKLFAFVVSACMAGIAGALYVPQVGIINPSEFAPANSIEVVIWTAVGGRATLAGPIIGAVLVNAGKSYFTAALPDAWLFVLGGLFIAVTLFLPKGIVGTLGQGWTASVESLRAAKAEAGSAPPPRNLPSIAVAPNGAVIQAAPAE